MSLFIIFSPQQSHGAQIDNDDGNDLDFLPDLHQPSINFTDNHSQQFVIQDEPISSHKIYNRESSFDNNHGFMNRNALHAVPKPRIYSQIPKISKPYGDKLNHTSTCKFKQHYPQRQFYQQQQPNHIRSSLSSTNNNFKTQNSEQSSRYQAYCNSQVPRYNSHQQYHHFPTQSHPHHNHHGGLKEVEGMHHNLTPNYESSGRQSSVDAPIVHSSGHFPITPPVPLPDFLQSSKTNSYVPFKFQQPNSLKHYGASNDPTDYRDVFSHNRRYSYDNLPVDVHNGNSQGPKNFYSSCQFYDRKNDASDNNNIVGNYNAQHTVNSSPHGGSYTGNNKISVNNVAIDEQAKITKHLDTIDMIEHSKRAKVSQELEGPEENGCVKIDTESSSNNGFDGDEVAIEWSDRATQQQYSNDTTTNINTYSSHNDNNGSTNANAQSLLISKPLIADMIALTCADAQNQRRYANSLQKHSKIFAQTFDEFKHLNTMNQMSNDRVHEYVHNNCLSHKPSQLKSLQINKAKLLEYSPDYLPQKWIYQNCYEHTFDTIDAQTFKNLIAFKRALWSETSAEECIDSIVKTKKNFMLTAKKVNKKVSDVIELYYKKKQMIYPAKYAPKYAPLAADEQSDSAEGSDSEASEISDSNASSSKSSSLGTIENNISEDLTKNHEQAINEHEKGIIILNKPKKLSVSKSVPSKLGNCI